MKNWISSILLGLVVVVGSFFYGRNTVDCSLPTGQIVIEQSYLDSLQAVANSTPDTITKTDTLYVDKVVWKEKPGTTIDSVVYTYIDSVITDTVNIYQTIDFNNNTKVFKSELEYDLNIPVVVKEITHKVPMPYEVEKVIYKMDEAWYFTGGIGTAVNDGTIVPSIGLTRVNDGNMLYGASVGTFNSQLFLNFNYGLKIK